VIILSNFQKDLKAEELMGKWLDKYFYSKLDCTQVGNLRVNKLSPPSRINEAQKAGVDIILKDSLSEIYLVDEKAQFLYLNNPLPTFAFEIQYEKNGKVKEGWLFDDNKKTTHYLLIYPKSKLKKTIYKVNHFEDFTNAELLLINRERLKSELKIKGVDKRALNREVPKIKVNNKKIKIGDGELYLMKSGQLTENPVNLVIKKQLLDRISIARWEVSKVDIIENEEGIKWIKGT